MLIFFLMNFLVAWPAFWLAAKVFKISNPLDLAISSAVIYFSQIVLTETVLGILGILYLKNVILLNLAVFLGVRLLTFKRPSALTIKQIEYPKKEFSTLLVSLFLLSVILVFAKVKLAFNLVNPPFGWDSLNYHFTFAVEWLKNGNLDIPITISDDPSPSYYPINGSLYYLWLMFPFRSVFMADLGQLPFFILSFLSVFSISRKIGLNRQFAFYAAGLFLLIPNFFKQLSLAYVDIMVAGLFLVCTVYLFELQKEFSLRYAMLYALTLGLLLGTKTVALPYSIILFVPFLWFCLKNINKAYLLPICIMAVAALGGFAYLRNFLETGNPLYPLDLQLFGRNIFKGVMSKALYAAHFKIEDYCLSKILFHEGLGAQSLLFVLPSVFLALPLAILKKRKMLNFNLVYFFTLPIQLYLVYRYVIPLANTRYLYCLLAIGLISGFLIISILNIPRLIVDIMVFSCTLASLPELAKRGELVVAIIWTFLLLFLLFTKKFRRLLRFHRHPAVIIFGLAIVFFGLIYLEHDYKKNEFIRYKKMVKYSHFWPDAIDAWIWLNNRTSGNNIAYVGRPVPFPLYGTDFKNNVYYVSVNRTDPAKLHYFSGSRYSWGYDFESLHTNLEEPDNYRGKADYGIWLSNLLRRSTDYLFIYSLHQTKETIFPKEDIWAAAHPEKFSPVFHNATVHIYQIKR